MGTDVVFGKCKKQNDIISYSSLLSAKFDLTAYDGMAEYWVPDIHFTLSISLKKKISSHVSLSAQ